MLEVARSIEMWKITAIDGFVVDNAQLKVARMISNRVCEEKNLNQREYYDVSDFSVRK
jgi:hypothetical protein